MSAIAPTDVAELDTCLAAADLPAAFAILQRYPDLRHNDLPSVEKAALKAIAAHPPAVRQMVLGFASLSPSIRRFCKKYYPKLGPGAAPDLLYLLVESLDPLRPAANDAEGLLGSCGGYASPLGQAIREGKLSTTIRRPEIQVYSDASRFVREVLELLPSALAATKFETFVLGLEYYAGLAAHLHSIPKGYVPPFGRTDGEFMLGTLYNLTNAFQEVVRSRAAKGDSLLFEAMQGWLDGKAQLEHDCWNDTAIAPVRARYQQLRWVEVATKNLQYTTASYFACFPQVQRVALYRAIQARIAQMGDDRQAYLMVGNNLRYYRDRYPDEAKLADLPEPPAPSEPSRSQAEESIPAPAASDRPQPTPNPSGLHSAPKFAASRDDALHSLFAIAQWLDLHGVARDLFVQDLEYGLREEFPEPSTDPAVQQDEQLLQALRQLVKDRGRRFSLVAMEQSEYVAPLAALMQRALTAACDRARGVDFTSDRTTETAEDMETLDRLHYQLMGLMQAALIFLPDSYFLAWLDLWRDRVAPLRPFARYSFSQHDALPKLVSTRFPTEAPFLLLEWRAGVTWPSCDSSWQLHLAEVYAQGDARSRETVRQQLASASLEPNSYYRRHDWNSPYLWLFAQWWEKQDTELLALACDRCAVPMYWKGDNAYSPIVKQMRDDRSYAPHTHTSSDGAIAVRDLCQVVCDRHPDRLEGIVRNNLKLADAERSACTLLRCVAQQAEDITPFQQHVSELAELLESPHTYAIAAGLDIFTTRPELAATCLDDVLLAADRALAATTVSVAKQALACLGQLAIAHPAARERALTHLENALYAESNSLLEETLKVWKKVLSKAKGTVFPTAAIPRLEELAATDPKRFGTLVPALLQ